MEGEGWVGEKVRGKGRARKKKGRTICGFGEEQCQDNNHQG